MGKTSTKINCCEGHPLRVSCKQDWGQGFILLLSGADAGNDGVESASGLWSPMYGVCYEGQSKNNEPKSLLAIFVAIKSKVIHQKKAQG